MKISDTLVEKYKKGTKPEQDATQAEVDEINNLLMETVDQTEIDFNNNTFVNYQEYPTSTGFVLKMMLWHSIVFMKGYILELF
jgi:predicted secreted Zn-dependent protease